MRKKKPEIKQVVELAEKISTEKLIGIPWQFSVGTTCFYCRGHGSDFWSGNKIMWSSGCGKKKQENFINIIKDMKRKVIMNNR